VVDVLLINLDYYLYSYYVMSFLKDFGENLLDLANPFDRNNPVLNLIEDLSPETIH
jgi:hypothetical protein